MRILAMMAMTMFFIAGVASATTINLNDGRTIQGDVLSQDSKSLQVSVDGVTMTYYADEIKDINGKPFGSLTAPTSQTQPEVAPVPQVVNPVADSAPVSSTVEPVAVPAPAPPVPAPAAQVDNSVAVVAPVVAANTIDEDKKALILKFIDVFGTRQALINNFDAMLTQIAKDKPDEAEKIRQRVKVDEIIDRLLPIYDRNFSSDDLKAFISFYGSAEGQKLIHTIPELMKESVVESVKYMKEKFPEVK